MSNQGQTIRPTGAKINDRGGLEIFQNGQLVTTITGRSWKVAIANGTSIFALGAAGTIVEINGQLEMHSFQTRIKNATELQWFNNLLYVFKDDGSADVFAADRTYVETHAPQISPTPTPTVTPTTTGTPTPTPTSTPAKTPTPTNTPTETSTPTPTPSITPKETFRLFAKLARFF